MARITELPAPSAIELTELRTPSPAPSMAQTPALTGSSTEVDTLSLASTQAAAIAAYLTSSKKPSGRAVASLLREPVLLTKTGQTVEKDEAGRSPQAPNRMLQEAIAVYTASEGPLEAGSDWHGIVDPITLSAPELAVQVVSSYRNKAAGTGVTTDYQEHHVFEAQSLIDWFTANRHSRKSPLSRGAIVLPLRISANIAVSNLVRDQLESRKPPLTAQQEVEFVNYCEQLSTHMTYAFEQPAPGYFGRRTQTAKITAGLSIAAGITSVFAWHFLKQLVQAPKTAPRFQTPANYTGAYNFYYACAAQWSEQAEAEKQTWTLYGCEADPKACYDIPTYTCDDYEPSAYEPWAGRKSKRDETVTPNELIGSDLFNACMAQQASCVPAIAAFDAETRNYPSRMSHFRHLQDRAGMLHDTFDAAAAIIFLAAVGIAGFAWARGIKPPPKMPTLSLAADDV